MISCVHKLAWLNKQKSYIKGDLNYEWNVGIPLAIEDEDEKEYGQEEIPTSNYETLLKSNTNIINVSDNKEESNSDS